MTVGQLLSELDAGIDSDEVHKDKTYKFVRIDSYQEALQYKEYVPDWCIVESREAFDEHIEDGRNHFVFCIREDIDDYPCKTFGDSYPYDNYGLSMIAVCVNGWGELVSVTSRWNYVEAEHYDNFLTREELSELFRLSDNSYDFEKAFCPDRIKTILHLSDTHGMHGLLGDLPPADLIVHSGDVGMAGTEEEIMDFLNWFLDLPYRYKVFVPGNHDSCLQGACVEGLDDNCFILNYNDIVVEGLRIYGVTAFVEDSISGKDRRHIMMIPPDTDILVTHQPPYGILDFANDIHYGSHALLKQICEVRPPIVLCGHIHDAYGKEECDGIRIYNSSVSDEKYHLKNKPQLIRL